MYAIVSIAGQQFKVEKGQKVFVHKLRGEVGDEVSFDKVLLINNDEKINVGAPYLPDAFVSAQIVTQLRGDKVLVFKKKRRKGYQKLNGHRQYFTEIRIEEIAESGASTKPAKTTAPKKEKSTDPTVAAAKPAKARKSEKAGTKTAPKTEPKKAAPGSKAGATKKAAVKKATGAAVKKPAVKKPAAAKEGDSAK